MRWLWSVAALAILTAMSSGASAEDLVWKKVYSKSPASQKDTIPVVGAAEGGVMVAVGQEEGSNGTMPFLLTSTNGKSFNKGAMPTHPSIPIAGFNFFAEIVMVGQKQGYASCPLGGVWITVDNGATWNLTGLDKATATSQLSCIGTKECWASALKQQPVLYHTTDDGFTFQPAVTLPADASATITEIFFLDALTGFVGGCTETYQTVNDQETLVAAGDGFILRTDNGGASWTAVQQGLAWCPGEIFMLDRQTGLAAGQTRTYSALTAAAFITTDGFATMTSLLGSLEEGKIPAKGLDGTSLFSIAGVYLSDAKTGWVVGSYGAEGNGPMNNSFYFHTTDGGSTFSVIQDEAGGGHTIYEVYFCGPSCAFAVGDAHLVLRLGDATTPVDGDQDGAAGDNPSDSVADQETSGPGWPGTACRNPGNLDLPMCDPARGADTCLYDDNSSFCTYACNVSGQCGSFFTSCCKTYKVNGTEQKFCSWDTNDCAGGDTPSYSAASGQSLGEVCDPPGGAGDCGAAFGATFCLGGGPDGPFCTRPCAANVECPDTHCCAELGPGMKYCAYGSALVELYCPAPEIDGDEDVSAVDSDSAADFDPWGHNASGAGGGGGGCAGSGVTMGLLAVAMMGLRPRRRPLP